MNEVTMIGVDLAKSVFQAHGATATGEPVFRKKLSRGQFLKFLSEHPPCVVAMEACASSHYWGREIMKLGHDVRLIPPIYVKPFVKRQKNDANDAEAIAEAAVRPTMRFVPVKSAEQQSRSMVFKTRDLFVRQRNAIINALRGHLMEYGIIAPPGRNFVKKLAEQIENPDSDLPSIVMELSRVHLDQLSVITDKVVAIERRLRRSRNLTRRRSVCRQHRALAQSAPWQSKRSHPHWRASREDVIMPHGLGWSLSRNPPAAGKY